MILTYQDIDYNFVSLIFLFSFIRKLTKKEDPKRFKEKILSSHFNVKKKGTQNSFGFMPLVLENLKV